MKLHVMDMYLCHHLSSSICKSIASIFSFFFSKANQVHFSLHAFQKTFSVAVDLSSAVNSSKRRMAEFPTLRVPS